MTPRLFVAWFFFGWMTVGLGIMLEHLVDFNNSMMFGWVVLLVASYLFIAALLWRRP